jgi:hypothetical protein
MTSPARAKGHSRAAVSLGGGAILAAGGFESGTLNKAQSLLLNPGLAPTYAPLF